MDHDATELAALSPFCAEFLRPIESSARSAGGHLLLLASVSRDRANSLLILRHLWHSRSRIGIVPSFQSNRCISGSTTADDGRSGLVVLDIDAESRR